MVITVLPKIVVWPVEEPIENKPARVPRFDSEVVAASRVSNKEFVRYPAEA